MTQQDFEATEKRQRLAESQAQLRRLSTWGLGSLAIGMVLLGVGGWWWAGEASWLHVCLWLAPFMLLRAFYNQFFLLNPRSDPIETEKKLAANRPGGANARKVARWNGWLLVVASPFLFLVALDVGIDGYWGILSGLMMGAVWLGTGIFMIRWGRSAPKSWWRH